MAHHNQHNPHIKRMTADDFYPHSPSIFYLTAQEIADVVEWVDRHIWQKPDRTNPNTLPKRGVKICLYLPDRTPSVVEGYMDNNLLFRTTGYPDVVIEPALWRPMPDVPKSHEAVE